MEGDQTNERETTLAAFFKEDVMTRSDAETIATALTKAGLSLQQIQAIARSWWGSSRDPNHKVDIQSWLTEGDFSGNPNVVAFFVEERLKAFVWPTEKQGEHSGLPSNFAKQGQWSYNVKTTRTVTSTDGSEEVKTSEVSLPWSGAKRLYKEMQERATGPEQDQAISFAWIKNDGTEIAVPLDTSKLVQPHDGRKKTLTEATALIASDTNVTGPSGSLRSILDLHYGVGAADEDASEDDEDEEAGDEENENGGQEGGSSAQGEGPFCG